MKLSLLFFACFTVSGGLTPMAAQTLDPTPATPVFTATALTTPEMIDLQKIREYYAEGDYQTALSLCQNAIFENSNNWEAYVQLAQCFHALGKNEKAVIAARRARELHPGDPATDLLVQSLQSEIPITPTPQAEESTRTTDQPVQSFQSGTPMTPTPPAAGTTPAAAPVISHKKKKHYPLWLKLGLFADYANLSALDDSAAIWNASLSAASGTGVGSLSRIGFGGTAELSWDLGQTSAIGIGMSYSGGHGFTETYSNNGQSESQLIDPQLFTIGLDYYQYFSESFGRFYLCAGGLFGQAVVQANSTTPSYTIGGTLGGSALGGEFGLGNEFTMGSDVSLDVSIRYRALVVTQVETSYTDNYGNAGELALAQNNTGAVFLADTRSITNGVTYAPLDFSGVLFGFSFNWRLL